MKIVEYEAIDAENVIETHEDARFLFVNVDRDFDVLVYALVDETRPVQHRLILCVPTEVAAQGLGTHRYVGSVNRHQGIVGDPACVHVFDAGPCAAPGEEIEQEGLEPEGGHR